jgi:hypothetical protein
MPAFNAIDVHNNSTIVSSLGSFLVVYTLSVITFERELKIDCHTNDIYNQNTVSGASQGSPFSEVGPSPPAHLTYSEIFNGLPDQQSASVLCNHYLENVSWVYYIIHAPTFIAQLADVYSALDASTLPDAGHLAIVATVISIGAYFKAGLALGSLTRDEVKANCNKWVNTSHFISNRRNIRLIHNN